MLLLMKLVYVEDWNEISGDLRLRMEDFAFC